MFKNTGMKNKYLFVVLFSACFFFTASAQQNYYDFIWQEKEDITDKDANEIIPPVYEWKSHAISNESPFIVLHSLNDRDLIVHKTTAALTKHI